VADAVLEVRALTKDFPVRRGLFRRPGVVRAVDGVSFTIGPGETLGLVGESGCGKSTLGRCVLRLLAPTSGQVRLQGADITRLSRRALRPFRRHMHIVFQDPYSSLNPRMRVGAIVAGPLRHHGVRDAGLVAGRVAELLDRVGLRPELAQRYPHQLSGGQRQRVAIARALVLRPALLVADEPLSALDASVQAATINLLVDLQRDLGFACLFITHDLSAAEYLGDRIAVMYRGRIVELAPRAELFAQPRHPYTQALLSAVPLPDPRAERARRPLVLETPPASPLETPPGCAFHPRCPAAIAHCRTAEPPLVDVTGHGHLASCHLIGPDGRGPILTELAAGGPSGPAAPPDRPAPLD
jgi:oligopeptide/dipeptide ABC transporter ATP-binding protein